MGDTDDLPSKGMIQLNFHVNEIAKFFGLMVIFEGWIPCGVCRRPKFTIDKDGKPCILKEF
jgi:hypothetical protein